MNVDLVVQALIAIVVICAVAWLILWAVGRFLAEFYPPARIIVGVIAIILIIMQLVKLGHAAGAF